MTTRVTLRLPDDQVEFLRAAVRRGEAPSASAYIAEAVGAWLDRRRTTSIFSNPDEGLERLRSSGREQ